MNRRTVLASPVVLLIVAGWSALAVAQDKTGAGVDPAKAMTEMQQQFLQQFDVDKDGKLNDQEKMMAQEAMRRQGWNMGIAPGGFPGSDQFVKQFDRNGDGKLDPMESMMAQAMFQRMRNNGHGVRGGPQVGGGGSSLPQPAMPVGPAGNGKPAKVKPLIKRFDKDGDGKLNADEKAAAQAELKNDKAKEKDPKAEKAPKKDK